MIHASMMALSGSERFMMGVRMHEAAREMVLASFPPGLSEAQTRSLLFERFYGQPLESKGIPSARIDEPTSRPWREIYTATEFRSFSCQLKLLSG